MLPYINWHYTWCKLSSLESCHTELYKLWQCHATMSNPIWSEICSDGLCSYFDVFKLLCFMWGVFINCIAFKLSFDAFGIVFITLQVQRRDNLQNIEIFGSERIWNNLERSERICWSFARVYIDLWLSGAHRHGGQSGRRQQKLWNLW